MLFEFLIFGTLWFWIAAIIFAAVVVVAIDNDRGLLATVALLAFVAALVLFGDFNPFPWLMRHPWAGVLLILAYFAIGAGWAIVKWWFYCTDMARKYREARFRFLEQNGVQGDAIPDHLREKWRENSRFSDRGPPNVRQNKSRIMLWMTYWPFSMFWTLLNDPIRRVFRHIYEYISGILHRISERAFAPFAGDFEK